ncbi:MAG TPA: hypothetical protein VN578_12910 [Candidatus Binatia bacterium]|jgi:hypothetical protein|nr:hypothetical protein [Candidatus Binatia bacterium]
MPAFPTHLKSVDYFLRAEPEGLAAWVVGRESRLVWFCVLAVVAGAGPYGAVMGCWWTPLQAFYVAIKLPLLILLTSLGNGLLNGMLAPLLGLNITFRQSLTAVLVSFAYAAMVLGAFSPVALFVVWNTPPLRATTWSSSPEYAFLQLTLVVFIALAGVVGNVRLLPLLRQLSGSRSVARKVLVAWLLGNLFLGSQICWVLRPFIWDPGRPVEFIGQQAFHGNFYEAVFNALKRVLF